MSAPCLPPPLSGRRWLLLCWRKPLSKSSVVTPWQRCAGTTRALCGPTAPMGRRRVGSERQNIALVGFMGSGKTTVGRILAERLGWVFVDTDTEIERSAGCDIPSLFQAEGEAAFRDRESTVVRAVCAEERLVI